MLQGYPVSAFQALGLQTYCHTCPGIYVAARDLKSGSHTCTLTVLSLSQFPPICLSLINSSLRHKETKGRRERETKTERERQTEREKTFFLVYFISLLCREWVLPVCKGPKQLGRVS